MSETPERIWAFAPDIFDNCSLWQDMPSPAGDTIEYIRAHHVDALLKAEREKALREAADKVADLYGEYSEGVPYCDRDEAVAVIEALISEDATDG